VAVKYREKVRRILTHIYGRSIAMVLVHIARKYLAEPTILTSKDVDMFTENILRYSERDTVDVLAGILLYIFGKGNAGDYPNDRFHVIPQVFSAKTNVRGCNLVPEEVLVGLLSNKNHPQHAELWSTKEKQAATLKMIREGSQVETANQAVRKTKQEKVKGIERKADVQEKIVAQADDPIALLKTYYEGGKDWSEVSGRVEEIARKSKASLPYRKIGIVIDDSKSMSGHYQESKWTPRAHASMTAITLSLTKDTATIRTEDSNLARAFLHIVDDSDPRDAVFILSDGYENCYDGLLDEVIEAWRGLTGSPIPIFHVSPVGAAEMNARARTLGRNLVSLTATYKTLGMAIQANLLQADTHGWLKNAVEALLI